MHENGNNLWLFLILKRTKLLTEIITIVHLEEMNILEHNRPYELLEDIKYSLIDSLDINIIIHNIREEWENPKIHSYLI